MSKRFPWNTVKGWTVKSLANGELVVQPNYITPPGLFTRLKMADWMLQRLTMRRSVGKDGDRG